MSQPVNEMGFEEFNARTKPFQHNIQWFLHLVGLVAKA